MARVVEIYAGAYASGKSVNFVNFVNKCAVCIFFQESVYIFRKITRGIVI